jgi:hypothetical protein
MAHCRDEFSAGVKAVLANRAGYRCSRPACRALTVGPSDQQPDAWTNVGVASHITAASPSGPRFDPQISSEERSSAANGIWLCQTHAKEIDDDTVQFTTTVLKAWKRAAEQDARALLGRAVSGQSLDVAVEATLHRATDNGLAVTGTTNLPDGTKLWVELHESADNRLLGQIPTTTNDGMFAGAGFKDGDIPYPHAWYTVEVLAYFNGPWGQAEAVLAIVGREGANLVGRFAEPLHPEFSESEKRFRAAFECVAPPVGGADRSPGDLKRATTLAYRAVLTVEDRVSASPVSEVVEWFMGTPGLTVKEGWSARSLPNGAVVVEYSFWNGEDPDVAQWIVILDTEEVRYWNLYGKYMSWLSED